MWTMHDKTVVFLYVAKNPHPASSMVTYHL